MTGNKKIKKILRVDKQESSSLSAFVERPVPSDQEVSSFEKAVDHEVRNYEIDNNLSEIYSDKRGGIVDVKKMKVKRRQSLIIRFFKKLSLLILFLIFSYLAYSYFFDKSGDSSALEFKIEAPEKIMIGEEFSYQIKYHNPSKIVLRKVYLEMQYPENFIITNFSTPPQSGNYGWNLEEINSGANGTLTITGKLINKPESVNVISGRLSYVPANYSSQFKKEASVSTVLSELGFRADLEYSQTAFVGQENSIKLILSDLKENFLGDFNLSFSLPEETNISVEETASSTDQKGIIISKSGGVSWQISNLNVDSGRQEIPLFYKINTLVDNPEIKIRLEKKMEDGQAYTFWEKSFIPELVKSDLNLTMEINDSKNDGAVNFNDKLNYRISYSNQGKNTFKDAVILVALQGDFFDLNSLKMDVKGDVNGQTVIWTKEDVEALAEIKPGQTGEINFSIKISDFSENDLGKEMELVSYAQYGVNNQGTKGDDNKSNTVTFKINSDLNLSESIRYFNEDNLPVGSGPLPPRVGQDTYFKVYWTVKNNLHELTDARVVLNLPANVEWDGRNFTNVGNIFYDSANRQMIWNIGRLPLAVYRADAEFGIYLRPSENDVDKILVLSPGAIITAHDIETSNVITKKTGVKTTKLEDDDIASLNNSGQIQP